jgi:cell shape-determining protein MreD
MSAARAILVVVLCLWVAGGCQQALASLMSIGTAQPDFLLVILCVLAPLTGRRAGTVMGFATGVIHGAIAGANFTAYAITRTIGGFFLGWAASADVEVNFVVAGILCALTTVGIQLLFLFIAPPTDIVPFLLTTLGTATYNGLLAMPIHFALARLMPEKIR